jgi:hypothetical protein
MFFLQYDFAPTPWKQSRLRQSAQEANREGAFHRA